MSLSLCACPSAVILFSLEYSKHLKHDVMMELQGYLRGVCLMFQGRFKEGLRMLAESFKGVWKFQGSFKGINYKFQWCFNKFVRVFEVSRKFQGCFKEDLRVFTESFKGVSRKFKGSFREVSRVFQGSFREISRVFQERFKGVSTKIEGCFK